MTEQKTELLVKEYQLKEAKAVFGKAILDLNDITVEPKSILLEHGYTQEYLDEYDEEYLFSIDNASGWSFYLTGLVTEWVADYDYASGPFEGPYTQDDIDYLKALNAFMASYEDLDWNSEKANKIIQEFNN